MTAHPLPSRPSLEQLKKQAKDLLKAHRAGDASFRLLRNLHRFTDSTDADILAAKLTLAEVQFALAIDYGFTSWSELKSHVTDRQAQAPEPQPAPEPFLILEWQSHQQMDWDVQITLSESTFLKVIVARDDRANAIEYAINESGKCLHLQSSTSWQ